MEEKPESIPATDPPQPAPPQPDRRSHPRFGTDDPATLLVLNHGSTLSARILDLGLGGCRLQLPKGTRISCPARLEVSFRINGIALRLSGCSQWTDGRQTVGVRFGEMSSRRKDELIALLAEIEADQEAKAAKEAVDEARSKDSATEAPARRSTASAPIARPSEALPAPRPPMVQQSALAKVPEPKLPRWGTGKAGRPEGARAHFTPHRFGTGRHAATGIVACAPGSITRSGEIKFHPKQDRVRASHEDVRCWRRLLRSIRNTSSGPSPPFAPRAPSAGTPLCRYRGHHLLH